MCTLLIAMIVVILLAGLSSGTAPQEMIALRSNLKRSASHDFIPQRTRRLPPIPPYSNDIYILGIIALLGLLIYMTGAWGVSVFFIGDDIPDLSRHCIPWDRADEDPSLFSRWTRTGFCVLLMVLGCGISGVSLALHRYISNNMLQQQQQRYQPVHILRQRLDERIELAVRDQHRLDERTELFLRGRLDTRQLQPLYSSADMEDSARPPPPTFSLNPRHQTAHTAILAQPAPLSEEENGGANLSQSSAGPSEANQQIQSANSEEAGPYEVNQPTESDNSEEVGPSDANQQTETANSEEPLIRHRNC